jgi:3'-phosphoadenosine 5'-phosphosulfate sulfotransferase (PAPS reductase)/FAD synthetase
MRGVTLPPVIADALLAGAPLAVSVSGGKDSQAMLSVLKNLHRNAGGRWPGAIHAIHADLGRAEWPQTPGHVRFMCERLGVALTVVSRPQGDLLDEIRARVVTLGGTAPAWPSAGARYCTSDQKRSQIDKVLRSSPWPSATQRYCTADQKRDQLLKEQRKLGGIVVTAMGMRGEESSARARRPAVTIGKRLTSKRLREMAAEAALREVREGERLVIEWLPIHNWTEDDVWHELGYSLIDVNRRRRLARSGHQDEALAGWTAHPAYVLGLGNQRLSCSL